LHGHSLARILLVEDNPGDVLLIRKGLEQAGFANPLDVASDGEEAMARLLQQPPFQDVPLPDLVLLDINLPKLDGHEVLRRIKQDDNLRRLPVVMLTSSDADTDVVRAYDTHANAYLTKGFDLGELGATIRGLSHFWLALVTLPPSEEGAPP
jgi:two-component system response regulator